MSDLHLEFDEQAHDRRLGPSTGPSGDPSDGHDTREGAATPQRHNPDFFHRPAQPDADLLILAGDIHNDARGVDWADWHFTRPTILIAGNHEAYGGEWHEMLTHNRLRAAGTDGRVAFMECDTLVSEFATGELVRVIGTTLWTDFELDGDPGRAMMVAERRLADFQLIEFQSDGERRLLHPADTVDMHRASVQFLQRELARPFQGHTIVVTHHAPSERSVASKFHGDLLNPAFASKLEALIRTHQPSLWIHGHMHDSFDYGIGRTRVVCNPRGYFPDQLNPAFDPQFVVELRG